MILRTKDELVECTRGYKTIILANGKLTDYTVDDLPAGVQKLTACGVFERGYWEEVFPMANIESVVSDDINELYVICLAKNKKRKDMGRDRIANYNEHTFALLKAVASNDVDEVRILIKKDECRTILDDIALFSRPFPLHYITLCYVAIWRDADEWKDEEWANAVKTSTNKMVEFWEEYYGVDIDYFPHIEYCTYRDDFYCAWEDETDDDILMAPKSKFMELGAREIDLDLYCAVSRFQFGKVRELLMQGANPEAEIFDELNDNLVPFDSYSAIDRIDGEVSFLCCETMDFMRQLFNKQAHWFMGEKLFQDILGLAAHSDMYRLLTNM